MFAGVNSPKFDLGFRPRSHESPAVRKIATHLKLKTHLGSADDCHITVNGTDKIVVDENYCCFGRVERSVSRLLNWQKIVSGQMLSEASSDDTSISLDRYDRLEIGR